MESKYLHKFSKAILILQNELLYYLKHIKNIL